MAATYTFAATAVALPTTAAATTLLALFNSSTTKSWYVTRIWVVNSGTTVVTGVMQNLSVGKYTVNQTTGATAITPVKHDTNSTTLVSGTDYVAGTKPTTAITLVETVRFQTWDGDEFINNVSKTSNMLAFPIFGNIWDSGYADTNIEPLTLNSGEGVAINSAGIASGVGTVDLYIEGYFA